MGKERGNYGFQAQAIEDPAELKSVHAFRRRIRQVPGLLQWWQRLSEAEPLSDSDLRSDDAATAWRHLSAGVHYSLNFASDNLRLLHQQHRAEANDPTPFVASYPLARAALEAASLALWVVSPESREQRIQRHLRNAARELHEETVLRKFALKSASEARHELGFSGADIGRSEREFQQWRRKHREQIIDCAARNGLHNPLGERRIGYGEIVGEATEATGLPRSHGELVWMQISGLTHPSLMRATTTLAMDERSENADGTVNVMMTSKTDTVATAAVASVLQYRTALEFYSRRIQRPSRSGAALRPQSEPNSPA